MKIRYKTKPLNLGIAQVGSNEAISEVIDTCKDSYLVETPWGVSEVKFNDVLEELEK